MPVTSNAQDGLLAVNNGDFSARWNFPAMVGEPLDSGAGIGEGVLLSYSFSTKLPAYSAGTSGFLKFNTAQVEAATAVLDGFAQVTDLRFVETTGVGQLAFANSAQGGDQAGFAYLPFHEYSTLGNHVHSVSEDKDAGDVWLNRSSATTPGTWEPGQEGYHTLLHEIGHALGLKHPFEGTHTLATAFDNDRYTVMTYTPASNMLVLEMNEANTSYSMSYLRATTLMMADIDALQTLYGTDTTTRTGNDTYRWERNAEILETIWDAGGRDTIDCSNQVYTCVVDLQAPTFSSIALRQTYEEIRDGLGLPSWFEEDFDADVYDGSNNLGIARGVVIENAIGGSAADILTGNSAANSLSGNAGNDTLAGGSGNDSLAGGQGADSMTGGKGNDRYEVDSSSDAVRESSSGGKDLVLSYLTGYTLGNHVEEGRVMSSGSANLNGNSLDNVLYAGNGNNVLAGSGGSDTVSYEAARKGVAASLALTGAQATGGSGSDRFSSIENLTGSEHADRLTGSSGNNVLSGGLGNDSLLGGSGDDRLWGGVGRDALTGGSGRDIFDFDSLAEMGTRTSTRDVLADFVRGQDDIDLSTLDARSSSSANEAFSFIGGNAFSAAGQLRYIYTASKGYGILYGNTDSDSAAEFQIQVAGVSSLSASDFIA